MCRQASGKFHPLPKFAWGLFFPHKHKKIFPRATDMTQVVEDLPSKHKALNSKPPYHHQKKKRLFHLVLPTITLTPSDQNPELRFLLAK
jgi:hypothetical protein